VAVSRKLDIIFTQLPRIHNFELISSRAEQKSNKGLKKITNKQIKTKSVA